MVYVSFSYLLQTNVCAHIIENSGPSLHGDALEDGENSKQDVVKLSDAVVRTDPGVTARVAGGTLAHATGELQFRRDHCLIF